MTGPTAAPARWPYAHLSLEDHERIAEAEAAGDRNSVAYLRKTALDRAHAALARIAYAKLNATRTNSHDAPPMCREKGAVFSPNEAAPTFSEVRA